MMKLAGLYCFWPIPVRLFGGFSFGYLADFCSVVWRIIFQLFG
jgi:hypothetical protein